MRLLFNGNAHSDKCKKQKPNQAASDLIDEALEKWIRALIWLPPPKLLRLGRKMKGAKEGRVLVLSCFGAVSTQTWSQLGNSSNKSF